jgi:hypothetical protein
MGKYKTFGSRFDRVHRNDLNANFAAVEADINVQKDRVDDLITGTPQPSEVVDSRGGFPVLGERLNDLSSSLAQNMKLTNKLNGQIDFVEYVKGFTKPFTNMNVLKRATNAYQVHLFNDTKGIIYDFAKDTNDDFIKLYATFSGPVDNSTDGFVSKDVVSLADTTGTWVTSGSSLYTATVNNTFTLSAQGTKLILTINTETRGGLWSISVDGAAPITVSCYNATTVEKNVVIATGLANVTHTVVGTFLGDDPANPPSSSPSRGYLRVIDTTEKGTLTGYKPVPKIMPDKTILATASNKEFAFTVTKNSYQNWVPEHDAVGSAFNITPPEFYVDGNLVDVANITIGSSYAITINEKFELKQKFKGHAVGYGAVVDLETSHKILKDGILDFDGYMKATDSFSAVMYPMMLPSENDYMDEFVSGIYNYKTNNGSETYSYFTEEQDGVFSGAIISSKNKNLVAVGTLKNPIKTYRIGKTGKPSSGMDLFLWNRAVKPKMYWQSMGNHSVNAGDIYTWGFKLMVSDITNIYDSIKS